MSPFRIVPLALMGLALTAPAVQAQTTDAAPTGDEMLVSTPHAAAVPTASATAAKPAGDAKPMTTDEQIRAWLTDAPRLDRSTVAGGDGDADADAPAKRQIHGSAGVSMGSGGYSSAYVSTLIPVGKDGTLGLAYSQTDYGNGKSGRGYWRPRGRSQSVAVSLDMGGQTAKQNDACAPGFLDGGRYIEPVWVTRLHADRDCEVSAETYPGDAR